MIGKTFNKWTVIESAERDKWYKERWLCECGCEKKTRKLVTTYNLEHNISKDCGCGRTETIKAMFTKSLEGKRFGKLIVVKQVKNIKTKIAYLCQCDCGNKIVFQGYYLTNGNRSDCGCIKPFINKINRNYYEFKDNYVIGYTSKGEEFYFDIEDYDIVSKYVWHLNNHKYVLTNCPKSTKMYRLILKPSRNEIVDHINHNKSDNRKENLRICTHTNNNQNRRLHKNNTSGHTGVSWKKSSNMWYSYITKDKKRLCLGYFEDISDAIQSREEAEIKYFGEFRYRGNHNEISDQANNYDSRTKEEN
jgi:hypothetical protein